MSFPSQFQQHQRSSQASGVLPTAIAEGAINHFYEAAQNALVAIGHSVQNNTYVVDESHVARYVAVWHDGTVYFRYQSIMRAYVDGVLKSYICERLFNGVLVYQVETSLNNPILTPGYQQREATALDFTLYDIDEGEENTSPPPPDDSINVDPQGAEHLDRVLALRRCVGCAQSPLGNFLLSIASNVEPQALGDNLEAIPQCLHGWGKSMIEFLSGKRMTVKDEYLQQRIDDAYIAFEEEDTSVLTLFRYAVRNYREFVNSPLKKHFLNLLGVAISLGFLPEDASSFHYNTILVYQVKLSNFGSFADVIDVVVEATNYFVESIVASWSTQSFAPFLYEKTMSAELDQAYETVNRIDSMLRNKELDVARLDWSTVFKKYEAARVLYAHSSRCAEAGSAYKKLLSLRYEKLVSLCYDLQTMRIGGYTVKQAPCIIFYGAPGCGKTLLTKAMFTFYCALFDLDFDETMIADIITGDQYDSRFTNFTKFVRADDVANRPLKYDPSLGIAKILQICNNVQFTAVKAELELKGRVNPDIRLAVGTTNNKEMDMMHLSFCPNSLRRRVIRVDITVKPEFANDIGGVDELKVDRLKPPMIDIGGCKMQDIQTFTVNAVGGNGYQPKTVAINNGEYRVLENLSIYEFYSHMESFLLAWDKNQDEQLERVEAIKFAKCRDCGFILCRCSDSDCSEFLDPMPEPNPLPPAPDPVIQDPPQSFPNRPDPEIPIIAVERQSALKFIKEAEMVFYKGIFAGILGYSARCSDSFTAFFAMPSFMRNSAITNVTQAIFTVLEEDVRYQWWYWMPDELWDSGLGQLLSMLFPTQDILKTITVVRSRLNWCIGLWMWISMMMFYTFIFDARSPSIFRAMILMYTIPVTRFLCPFLPDWEIPHYDLPNKLGHFDYLAVIWCCVFMCWIYVGLTYRSLYVNSFEYLSRKRTGISDTGQELRKKYAPHIKILLGAIATVSATYMAYRFGKFVVYGDPDDMRGFSDFFASTLLAERCGVTAKPQPTDEGEEESVGTSEDEDEQESDSPQDGEDPDGVEPQLTPREISSIQQGITSSLPEGEEQFSDPMIDQMSTEEEDLRKKNDVVCAWKLRHYKQAIGYRNPNMTVPQLRNKVFKNLSALYKKVGDEAKFVCDGLWLRTDLLLVPRHILPSHGVPEFWKIVDNASNLSVDTFRTVSRDQCLAYENADVAVVVIKYRKKANIIPYFNPDPVSLRSDFIFRNESGVIDDVVSSTITGCPVTDQAFPEAKLIGWNWNRSTFKGACGGVYLSPDAPLSIQGIVQPRHPCILGIHIGGNTQENTMAVSFCPSQEDLRAFVALAIEKNPHHLFSPDEIDTSISRELNGAPLFNPSEQLPKFNLKTSTTWLIEQEVKSVQVNNQGAVFRGIRPCTAFYKSRAVDTIIAQDVLGKFQDMVRYGKPRLGRSMWAKSARFSFDTTVGFPNEHVKWAFLDYMYQLKRLPTYLLEDLRPLSREEILNGIDGLRFVDSMNFSTSMGPNFPGGKRDYIVTYIDGLTGNERKDFVQAVWTLMVEQEESFAKGHAIEWFYNATPKDEPTPVDKEKVRLFMVAEVACLCLVRKYFTPICRVIQMLPSLSECAVGMNCVSSEWEFAMQYLETFTRHFDGDYSKYDLRKNPSLSCASYAVMINLAAQGSYTECDLTVMTNMIEALISPLVNFNGEVWKLDGSTPSGIPVTVIINSIDNSLIHRCAYKAIYPNAKVGNFRKYVKLLTYGDDYIASVSWYATRYNFVSKSEYCKKYGMVVTPGIKDASHKKFVDFSKLVFLQRRSVSLPGVPYRVGQLHEKSILKALVCHLAGELSPEEAAATNVDNALREYALYGEKIFLERQEFLREVCEKHCIAHLCRNLHARYKPFLYQTLHMLGSLDDS